MGNPKRSWHWQQAAAIYSLTALIGAGLLSSTPAAARDMQGRFGLGYNSEFSNSTSTNRVPGVSIKYGLTRDIAAEVIAGIDTSGPNSDSVTGIKFFKNIFYETNLNFYFMMGAGIVSALGKSGGDFLGGFGAEFFIPGIDSLGLAFETGGAFGNITGSFAVRTLGVSFLDAGIHFYF